MKTELYIHEEYVSDEVTNIVDRQIDLYEDAPITISKSIFDLQKPENRKSDHTLTIDIPGTHNNNKVFSEIFDVSSTVVATTPYNFSPSFNPNRHADVVLYRNRIVQIRGYLQLVDISVTNEKDVVYHCVIIGRVSNLFQDIGDLKMNEIDLKDFDHAWTRGNIEDSWDADIGEGYVYPLIDYGISSDELIYNVGELFPAIYVKQLIDSVFSTYGYRYQSEFFNTERFKRLVVPYCGTGEPKLNSGEVQDRAFEADRIADSSFLSLQTITARVIPFNNIVSNSDPAGYDNTTFRFTVPTGYNGTYTFKAHIEATIKNNSGSSKTIQAIFFDVMANNGIHQRRQTLNNFTLSAAATTDITIDIQDTLDLSEGDEVWIQAIVLNTASSTDDIGMQIKVKAGSVFYDVPGTTLFEGATWKLIYGLPSDVRVAEFLTSIIKMFNLYIEPDTLDPKKLIIEPRDDFYNETLVDLTDKLDVSREMNIKPMGALDARSYVFTFSQDGDYYNSTFNRQTSHVYGYRKMIVDNDFIKGENKVEVVFAPTPLSDSINRNDRIISKIQFLNNDKQVRTATASKMRILYWGGLVNCSPDFKIYAFTDKTTESYSSFPYAGHLDNVTTPTFDVNFGIPEIIFYGSGLPSINYTDANLFNLYWRKTLEEITDRDSKIVTAYFKLSEIEVNKLSFRNFYFVDKHYYRLYAVEYDVTSFDTVKLTLLKLKAAPAFVVTPETTNGGAQDAADGTKLPVTFEGYFRNANRFDQQSDAITFGQLNNVDGKGDGVIIVSDRNIVGQVRLVNVQGGYGNIVLHDSAQLLNCSGYSTNFEGETAVNNFQVPFTFESVVASGMVADLESTPVELLQSFPGFYTQVDEIIVKLLFGTDDYEGGTLIFAYSSTSATIGSVTSVLQQTDNAMQNADIGSGVIWKSDGIKLYGVGFVGTGDSELKVIIRYRLIPII